MRIILFVPTPLILAYYSRLVTRSSADDQTSVSTIALTEYAFMCGTLFVNNARDWACPSYYTSNSRFHNRSGIFLLRLPDRTLDASKYFGLYKLTLRMGTDPVKKAMALNRSVEVNWRCTYVPDGLVLYNVETGTVIGLEAETIPVNKQVRDGDDAQTSLALPMLPVYFRVGFWQITIEAVRQNYDEYRDLAEIHDEATGKRLLKVSVRMLCSKRTSCGNRRRMLMI